MRLIDADKLKQHISWWGREEKELVYTVVDLQPTVVDTKNQELEKFARFVAKQVMDTEFEDGVFAELACRKLERLGFVHAVGTEWVLDNDIADYMPGVER